MKLTAIQQEARIKEFLGLMNKLKKAKYQREFLLLYSEWLEEKEKAIQSIENMQRIYNDMKNLFFFVLRGDKQ